METSKKLRDIKGEFEMNPCEKCTKGIEKYKEIMKTSESIFDVANDFFDFLQECQKKCRKYKKIKDSSNDE